MTEDFDRIIRPRQAAQMLGMSIATYYRQVAAGKIPHRKISDRTGGTPHSFILSKINGA